MKRRTALLGAGSALAGGWLAGCGGGGGPQSGDTRLRLLHASVGTGALDLYLDNDRSSRGLAYAAVGGYKGVDDGVRVEIHPADSASVLATVSPALADERDHTLVAYGAAGSLKTRLLVDREGEPDSGRFKLRVLHAAPDAGALDVYLTGDNEQLADVAPLAPGLAVDALGDYAQRASGRWRIRVTGAGDASDLRLDLPDQALARGRIYTLVLVSGTGGVLVHGVLVAQGGGSADLANPAARVRLVASVAGGAAVAARVGAVALADGAVSPTVGGYRLVDAGSPTLAVTVGGNPVAAPALVLEPGSDTTLLVTGPADAPRVSVIRDDNRRPANATQAKVRLVHGAASLAAAPAGLTINLVALASAEFAAGSAYGSLAATTAADVLVSSALAPEPVYRADDQALAAGGVYTLFLLSAGDAVQGQLLRDV